MSDRFADFSLHLPAPGALTDTSADPASLDLDREVLQLFDEFRDRLLRYALSLGLSVHDGEEVIQEVFLALFKHLRLRKPRHNLRGWIFRVAHNLALKQRRVNHHIDHRRERDFFRFEEHRDANPNPEEQIIWNQRQQRLRALVRELPERDLWCLYLRSEGLRYREIASILGMSLGAVSNSLTRSFTRLNRTGGG